jgi:type I restriction enzyme R subunit
MADQSNFGFLKEHDPLFLQLASTAESAFASDPNTTLIKLRQLGEAIAQDLAARCGIEFDGKTSQADLLFKLNQEIRLDASVAELFHTLRIEGNRATHQFKTQHKEALDGLRIARALAIWFHQAFGKQGIAFKPGPFVAPTDPSQQLRELSTEIEQLRAQLLDANEKVENNRHLIELVAREKEQYAVLAEQMDAEARIFEQMAQEHAQQLRQERQAFEARLQAMQAELETKTQASQEVGATIKKATAELSLNEELTRILIDQQLIAAGWEADTEESAYQKGARPEKGKNKAISEWPTKGKQSADYVLFAGLTPIAVVEAKRKNVNVAGKITQAERYARGFTPTANMQSAWQQQGRCIKPQAGELIQDPAAGTAGFLIAADAYIKGQTDDLYDLDEKTQRFQRNQAFVGMELVPGTRRLALMNCLLHGMEGDDEGVVHLGNTLGQPGTHLPKADVILTNPPFGTAKGGEASVTRDDFTYKTSNKQLVFLQHIYRSLKPGGRAAVVLPDNVLFEAGVGNDIRRDLMHKCNLHTILRLPTGIFYAQGVKTNVLFF